MPEHRPLHGIALMLMAVLCFASLDASVKHLSRQVSILMLVWVRYGMQFLLMVAILGPHMGRGLLRTNRPGPMILRGFVMLATTGLGMVAFKTMPLAEATAVIFVSPLLVGLLSGPILKEQVGKARWAAMLVGFAGVLLIARPGGGISAEGLGWALATALAYAIYQLQTRHLAMHENTWTLLFYTALVGTFAMSLALPWYWQAQPFDGPVWGLMAGLGVLGGAGHFLLTRAFRMAPASTLSPLLYAQLIWAGLYGVVLFDHWPSGLSLLGMAIIAGSSLAMALYERQRSLRLARA